MTKNIVEIKTRKLTRSKENKIFLGLCHGIAEYYEIKTSLLRIFFILLALTQGVGTIIYLGVAIFIPEGKAEKKSPEKNSRKENIKKFVQELQNTERKLTESEKWHSSPRNIQGIIIIGIGLILLFNQFFNLWLNWQLIWPSLLILAGIYLILDND